MRPHLPRSSPSRLRLARFTLLSRSSRCSARARRRSRPPRRRRRLPSRRHGSSRPPQSPVPSSSRNSPPGITSAARWMSRSRSSTRRSRSTPTTRGSTTSTDSSTRSWARIRRPRRIPPRTGARAGRLGDSPELGLVSLPDGRPRESIAEFEAAVRNPLYRTPWIALINAGKCSAASGDAVAAQGFFRRALTASPNNPEAAYNFALLQYKSGNYADSRALMRIVMLQSNPPPEALYLACAPSASSATVSPSVVRDAAAQPLARRRGNPGDCRGNLRVTDSDARDAGRRRRPPASQPRARGRDAAAARAPPGCRSTRSRSS